MKGELLMASNFQLFLNQNRDSLHLHMFGDFDGISAYELINALKKHNIEEGVAKQIVRDGEDKWYVKIIKYS